jgi:tetratricopeptide (TPR) repeat protein
MNPHSSKRLATGARLAAILMLSPLLSANEQSKRLADQASLQVYSLDLESGVQTWEAAIRADPSDAAAYRGLAAALWARTAFLRGSMTIDSYLGRVTGTTAALPPPPPDLAAAFQHAVDRATALARARVERNPDDVDAQYELGAAIGLRASYTATVEGSVAGAFRSARTAYNAHERVLELNPARRDAGLIVGTYRYLVATLSLPVRWMAYMAGFGGGAARGLQLVESAASYKSDSQNEARLALVLLYNRERRYDDALRQLAYLREHYPDNRLLWLETASTFLRAGRAGDADRMLDEGMARFARDRRTKMFGEEALWFYKRGSARAALGRDLDARRDLQHALTVTARDWVHGRASLEIGKLALKTGDRDGARRALRQAVTLCARDEDGDVAAQARALLNSLP